MACLGRFLYLSIFFLFLASFCNTNIYFALTVFFSMFIDFAVGQPETRLGVVEKSLISEIPVVLKTQDGFFSSIHVSLERR